MLKKVVSRKPSKLVPVKRTVKKKLSLREKLQKLVGKGSFSYTDICECEVTKNNENILDVSYSIDVYNYCCGMYEIGNIKFEIEEEMPPGLAANMIAENLKISINNTLGGINRSGRKYGFSITLPIETDDFHIFGEAVKKAGFKEVGEFININSGNLLKHYVLL